MESFVKAKPNSKRESVKKIDSTHFSVAVKEPPKQGRTNQAIMEALANYFDAPVSSIKLVLGFSSKQKIFDIKM